MIFIKIYVYILFDKLFKNKIFKVVNFVIIKLLDENLYILISLIFI